MISMAHTSLLHIPTYLPTYIPTYLPTYIHTYLHTYIHTCIHTYIPTYLHTYIHTYIHTYLPTYIHTYLPTYLPTYIHTYIHQCMHAHKVTVLEYIYIINIYTYSYHPQITISATTLLLLCIQVGESHRKDCGIFGGTGTERVGAGRGKSQIWLEVSFFQGLSEATR